MKGGLSKLLISCTLDMDFTLTMDAYIVVCTKICLSDPLLIVKGDKYISNF